MNQLLVRLSRLARPLRAVLRALADRHHPVLAQIVATRRCNLSCTYCNEFDGVSAPVPLEKLRRRLDRLAELGTSIVTLSGGEPLLHPQRDELVAHIRRRGMLATLITNGYLLPPERIASLNRAGLDHLQISIDNLETYGRHDIRREYDGRKPCAAYCTIGCVHQASVLDGWRRPQNQEVLPERGPTEG